MYLAAATISVVLAAGCGGVVPGEAAMLRPPAEATDRVVTATPMPTPAPAGDGPQLTPMPAGMPESYMPVIETFACNPCAVDPGETATLRWDVRGAVWVTLDGRGVEAPGAEQVQPDQTTTYHLIAANENGRSEKMVTIEVRGLPVIHYFACEPCQVRAGEATTLSWDLSGGTAAYLDGEGVTAPGSAVFVPDKTTTYHLEAVGERGSVERLVTVTVIESGDAGTVTRALAALGYRVRSVGSYALASGGSSMTVIMTPACEPPAECRQATAEQFFWGIKTLYDNFPGAQLSVGVHDGRRYTTFLTIPAAAVQAYLSGVLDGNSLWEAGHWNVWDDWSGHWTPRPGWPFADKDFSGVRLPR
jgi:hypothetical protein